MTHHPFEDAELRARIAAAEDWSAPGDARSHLPAADLIALAVLVVVVCAVAWVWGAPA